MTDRISYLREQCANYGIRISTDPHLKGHTNADLMGTYDRSTRTICIARNLSSAQLLVTLEHEYIHAMHDENGTLDPDPQIEEARTRRETAQALISPIEYRLAEQMYGNNTWLIASQLNVTPAVVSDWQRAVRDNPKLIQMQRTEE